MAKGGGSARLRWLVADPLEGRLLLSHATGPAIVHAPVSPPIHAAPTPARPRPKPEHDHVAPHHAEARAAGHKEAPTAASATSKNGPTIPGLTSVEPTAHLDGSVDPARGVPHPAQCFMVGHRADPVAWRMMVEGAPGVGLISRNRVVKAPEVPESAASVTEGARPGRASSRPTAPEAPEAMSPPERADLLDDFRPSDREALERAIDGLLGGLGGLGVDHSGGVEAATPIPSPVAWGFALAVLEAARQRLRRRSGQAEEGEQDPDGPPGRGFLAFRG